MAKLRVLFIGDTGVIISACSRVAVERQITSDDVLSDKAHSMIFDHANVRGLVSAAWSQW